MYIALDYDDTYTLDPAAWDEFILMMQEHQHEVYIVTGRSKPIPKKHRKHLSDLVDGIYYTGGKAKKPYMERIGIYINIWCDDNPKRILKDKKPKLKEI